MPSVAVLVNTFASPITPENRASFTSAIQAASPSSTVAFYDPIEAQIYPDTEQYDLIVLSGGTADPMGQDAWVLKLQDWIRSTVKEFPKQKFVGICWGHQTMCVTFGGEVSPMEMPEVGVTKIALTDAGKGFLPFGAQSGEFKVHEYHKREIRKPASGFTALADRNQSFLSQSNTIVTFQGHPELNGDLAKQWLQNSPTYMGVEESEKKQLMERAGEAHDGGKIWGRIMQWLKEE